MLLKRFSYAYWSIFWFAVLCCIFSLLLCLTHSSLLQPIVGLPGIEYTALRGAQSWSWAPKGAVPGTRRTVATSSLVDKLKSGYKAFSEGKFVEAIGIFRSILLILPFVEVTGKSELSEVIFRMQNVWR